MKPEYKTFSSEDGKIKIKFDKKLCTFEMDLFTGKRTILQKCDQRIAETISKKYGFTFDAGKLKKSIVCDTSPTGYGLSKCLSSVDEISTKYHSAKHEIDNALEREMISARIPNYIKENLEKDGNMSEELNVILCDKYYEKLQKRGDKK